MVPRKQAANRVRHFPVSSPAPVGGLNVRDAINAMPATDAIDLVNWIPQQYGVRARKGWVEWCTGLGAPVRTIMQYEPNRQDSSLTRLFAATDDAIYDVTSSSSFPPVRISLGGSVGISRMSSVSFSNTAGNFLLACSHEGGYWTYDGSFWVKRTAGAGAGQISGINPDNLVFITSWKRRLWFIEKNSTNAWYSATDAITGTLTRFELGPFAKRGGKLSFIANWTIDAGEGIDDLIVFGFENGDVLIYKGTDPASASSFALVGVYFAGALALGRRNFVTMGGDVLILSELGLQPLSYITRGGQSLLRASATDYLGKIQPRLVELISQFSRQTDWNLVLHPRENLLLIQVPTVTSVDVQYALYTNTNTWTTLQGIPMKCSEVSGNKLYFGTEDGRVGIAFEGYFDNVPRGGSTGTGISGVIQTAYSYFGRPGMNKHFQMIRPTFLGTDRPLFAAQMLADYNPQVPPGFSVGGSSGSAIWDTSFWDAVRWEGALNTYSDWLSVEALGYTGSAYLTTICVGDTFLASIDYLMEPGGSL